MCIFCQIVKKEIPASIFYEDEIALAFLDIKPVNPGHALVIPKGHVANLEEISDSDLALLIG
ncbi:MAG: HIT domain-containing protein, partial [Patescibacteria group bacterium]